MTEVISLSIYNYKRVLRQSTWIDLEFRFTPSVRLNRNQKVVLPLGRQGLPILETRRIKPCGVAKLSGQTKTRRGERAQILNFQILEFQFSAAFLVARKPWHINAHLGHFPHTNLAL